MRQVDPQVDQSHACRHLSLFLDTFGSQETRFFLLPGAREVPREPCFHIAKSQENGHSVGMANQGKMRSVR